MLRRLTPEQGLNGRWCVQSAEILTEALKTFC